MQTFFCENLRDSSGKDQEEEEKKDEFRGHW